MDNSYSLSEQIKCVEREIEMRKRVYPRLVISHKMTQGQADKELNLMKAVYQTLIVVSQKHLLQPFNQPQPCQPENGAGPNVASVTHTSPQTNHTEATPSILTERT